MAFQDAINRGAIDEAVALFHDAPAGLVIPVPFSLRLTDVRDLTEFEVGLGLKLELTGCQLEGDAVNCQMLLNNDCIKPIVPGGLPGTAKIKVSGRQDQSTDDRGGSRRRGEEMVGHHVLQNR